MTEGGHTSALDAVTVLMDERRRYESWLSALDARRSSTHAQVFMRVHADYTARLHTVMAQLTTHAEGLRIEVERLVTHLATLEEQQQHHADERAEAELRAHVGELSADAWEATARAIDERLTDLSAQQRTYEQELELTREMLSGTAPDDAPAAPVGDESEADMYVPAAVVPPELEAPTSEADAPASESVSDVAAPQGTPAPAFDELAFLSSVVDTPSGAMEAPPKDFPDERTRRDTFALREHEGASAVLPDQMTPPRQLASIEYEQEGEPLLARVLPAEGARTLKCYKCGVMNYPTEWYCVSCGAELASL